MAITTRAYAAGYVFETEDGVELDIEGGGATLSLTLTGPEYRDRDNYPTHDSLDIDLGVPEVKDLILNLTVWVEQQQEVRV